MCVCVRVEIISQWVIHLYVYILMYVYIYLYIYILKKKKKHGFQATFLCQEYKRDNTGGPRGQLAAHPAAAQFVIDNAAPRYSNGHGA